MFVTGSYHGGAALIDPNSKQTWSESHDGLATRGVTASPDGQYIFVLNQIYRASDGAMVASFPYVPDGMVDGAQWDPKGRYVAFTNIGNPDQNILFLWRPFEAKPSYDKIIQSSSFSLAVSPDGDRIAVATGEGIVIYRIG